MTQPNDQSNDPWATAQAAPASAPPATSDTSALAGSYGPAAAGSMLFNSGPGAPSLFNKTHPLGSERGGIIVSLTDKQDVDFNSKAPKFWSASKTGGPQRNSAVTTDAIDRVTGAKNEPVMTVHVELQTDYRITEAECVATGRDVAYVGQDTGTRVEVIGGYDVKAFAEAMTKARAAGVNLAGPQDLIGLRLDKKRIGQKPNPGGNPSWINAYRLTKP